MVLGQLISSMMPPSCLRVPQDDGQAVSLAKACEKTPGTGHGLPLNMTFPQPVLLCIAQARDNVSKFGY